MELRQLAYLDAVVRHGGFGRAARALHVAQPAVSTQIRKLERELGATLLSRTTRRVALTEAGEVVLARARRARAELDAMPADLGALRDVLVGRVRLGVIQALGPFDLPGALAAFHARHPGVTLGLRSGDTRTLLDDLVHDRVDVALVPTPAPPPSGVVAEPLFTDELVLVTAPDHPTAGRGPLPVTELAGDPFVCLPAGSGLRRMLDRLAGDLPVTVAFETANLPLLRDLVANGLGVALVARSVAETPGGPPVVVHPVAPDPVWRPVGLLHRPPPGPAVSACLAVLREQAAARR